MEKNIGEKISYLQGLAEGLKVDEGTNEGRIIKGILDVLADMTEYINDMEDELEATLDCVDEISEDLADVEDEIYGCDDDCGGDCGCCDCDCDDDDEYEEYDDDIYEIECPSCGELVYADVDTIENEDIYCPKCKKMIEVEIPEEDEE